MSRFPGKAVEKPQGSQPDSARTPRASEEATAPVPRSQPAARRWMGIVLAAVCSRVKLLLDRFQAGGGGVNECYSPPSCRERSLEIPEISQRIDKKTYRRGCDRLLGRRRGPRSSLRSVPCVCVCSSPVCGPPLEHRRHLGRCGEPGGWLSAAAGSCCVPAGAARDGGISRGSYARPPPPQGRQGDVKQYLRRAGFRNVGSCTENVPREEM